MNEPMKTTFSQSIYAQSSVRKEILGCLRTLDDGRKFNYARAGGIALTAGAPVEGVDAVGHHWNRAVVGTAIAVGSTTVLVTLGATLVTENQYQFGFLQINAGAGIGRSYRIASHPAAALSTNVLIQLDEPIGVALAAATSKASLIYNDFQDVVVSTAATKTPAGVPPIAVTAEYYFWSQTFGPAGAIVDNAVAVGTELSGGAGILAARTAWTDNSYGFCRGTAGVTAELKPVMLTMG